MRISSNVCLSAALKRDAEFDVDATEPALCGACCCCVVFLELARAVTGVDVTLCGLSGSDSSETPCP
jgi:hypothetical protein